MPDPRISAIVLAGGRATRLGGSDKALLPLAGRPLLDHVLARLAPQVDDIVINYNRDDPAMTAFGYPLVADTLPGHAGPLAGIAAALPHCRHDRVLVVPCDTPLLPPDLVQCLAAALLPDVDLVTVHDGQRLQPLIMLLRRKLQASLQGFLANGDRKVERWCREQALAVVELDSPLAFTNVNTAEERQRVEAYLQQQTAPDL